MDGPDEVASILMGWASQDMKYPGQWDQDQVTFSPLTLLCSALYNITDAIPVFWTYLIFVDLALAKLQVESKLLKGATDMGGWILDNIDKDPRISDIVGFLVVLDPCF